MNLSREQVEMELNLMLGSAFHSEREKLLTHDAEQRAWIEQLTQQVENLEAEIVAYRMALGALYDAQNGPPKLGDWVKWNSAMQAARAALKEEA